MQFVRRAIKDQILGMVGGGSGEAPPRKDDGLFGPGSASWAVHGDFTAMMIGGVGALLLQMLHPGALAGVWDHSDFRRDMSGRLRRTARFISGVTYGSTDQATALIARVRAVHDRVGGTLPDGTPYHANDPALLTWVHAAEVRCFLAAHLRYRNPFLSPAAQDRYVAEQAVVARMLGATDVPMTRRGIDDYLQAMRPQLRYDRRTREVARVLLSQRSENIAFAPFQQVMRDAGVDLLPDWAARMHGFDAPARRKPVVRAGAAGVGAVLRWAMREPAKA